MSEPTDATSDVRGRRLIGLLALLCLISGLTLIARDEHGGARLTATAQAANAKPAKAKGRPNILVIESDDQTLESQRVMNETNRLIGGRGATFRDSFVSNPLCCPSRATFLTGQYSRNNGVRTNNLPDGGYSKLNNNDTLPVWLQDSGYYTALIGKYLNGYEKTPQPQTIPPGWTSWQGTTKTYKFYDYQLNENGNLVDYGHDPADYQTDVFTQKAVDLIQQRKGTRKPWFTWLTYLAPHDGGPNPSPNPPANCDGSAKPAPRDAGAFADEPLPFAPSFNEDDVSDKPSFIANQTSFTQDDVDNIKRRYRCRLGSLLALDDGVKKVIKTLRQTGQLSNTYVIYTSDNGWFDGQHRIANGKRRLYEPSIRVPLMIRGPGIKPGTSVKDLVVNADLAPTITKLAKASKEVRRDFDGRPLQPFLSHPGIQRGRQLLLNGTRKRGTAIRNRRYYYAHFVSGEYEMYDLQVDPDQLQNIYGDPSYADVQAALDADLNRLKRCAGDRCTEGTGARVTVSRRKGPGRQCRRSPVSAKALIAGGDLLKVSFRVNGGPRTVDTEAPFEVRIPPDERRGRKQVMIAARADLIDGRRVDLSKVARICR